MPYFLVIQITVEFLLADDDLNCHVYAAIYGKEQDFDRPGFRDETEGGGVIETPNGNTESVGVDSTYLKIQSISCGGCKEAKELHEYYFTVV